MGDPILGGEYGYSTGDILANPLGPGLGKPSSAMQSAQTQALIDASMIPKALWESTSSIRGPLLGQLTEFMQGNTDITKLPIYAPGKAATESAYNQAKNEIIGNAPSGGLLQSQLADLSQQKALNMSSIIGNAQQDLFNKAYGASLGTPQVSISGANQAAGNLSNYVAAQQASASKQAQGIGEAIGYMAMK